MGMFVVVNYGDKEKALFNPNCRTRLLLENIKDRCQFPREIEIDLSNKTGNLKNLSPTTCEYASEILTTEREELVPIEIRRNTAQTDDVTDGVKHLLEVPHNAADVTYIPLLNDQDIVTPSFKKQLTNRGSPSATDGAKDKKRRKGRKERNTETLNSSLDKSGFDLLSAQQSPPSTSLRRNGSSKGARRASVTQNRSKSKGKNK